VDLHGDEPVTEPEADSPEETDQPLEDVEETPGGYEADSSDEDGRAKKYYVGDVWVKVLSQRVQYVDKDGKLITESLIDYTRKNILQQYARLDDFLKRWTAAQQKQAIIEEMKQEGVLLDAVRAETGQAELDDFDLICHLAYDQAPLTKAERAGNVKKRHYLYKYSEVAQQVLAALLDKYANEGLKDIESTKDVSICIKTFAYKNDKYSGKTPMACYSRYRWCIISDIR